MLTLVAHLISSVMKCLFRCVSHHSMGFLFPLIFRSFSYMLYTHSLWVVSRADNICSTVWFSTLFMETLDEQNT